MKRERAYYYIITNNNKLIIYIKTTFVNREYYLGLITLTSQLYIAN